MLDLGKIDELVKKLTEALPPGAAQLQEDLEVQFRAILKKAFERMELVTREEFDIQKAVLERAQVKLAALERQLQELESR
ncbi:MAG: accessory factor UbiK family protein [Xanthomonadales bacterium]|nr:accessory factor UbiK family protein [Xanthomonadales bacterium]NIN58701.1 accessory factor UbiK family protein [Xanthomonadales bacterium]NIN73967.1 accessory factor UbiK family protein [Xanthomonadales bacterium]NIO12882.1 accessory factor UbiK family protein [Xanthomonadales bacterium]NIP11094.1 accessory factor UbiK family protein [Xanthomonadales bacterium]